LVFIQKKNKEVVMKNSSSSSFAIIVALLVSLMSLGARAQYTIPEGETNFADRNLGGPRLGITYVPNNGALAEKLKSKGIGPVLSQFGWHFEYLVIPEGGGPMFAVQFVPLVAGVEYGTLIPSATLALGVRFPSGYEFGLGPNLLLGGDKGVNTSLVVAAGKSFNYGGVSIPVDIVWATNPSGNRFSIIFGYSIASAKK
jgi:hypothetical protein